VHTESIMMINRVPVPPQHMTAWTNGSTCHVNHTVTCTDADME